MPTFSAQIQTTTGTQSFQLAAATQDEAARIVEARAKEYGEGAFRFTIAQQSPLHSPEAVSGLIGASSALLGCIVALIAAEYKIRKWLKN
jgi:hypothetical protein